MATAILPHTAKDDSLAQKFKRPHARSESAVAGGYSFARSQDDEPRTPLQAQPIANGHARRPSHGFNSPIAPNGTQKHTHHPLASSPHSATGSAAVRFGRRYSTSLVDKDKEDDQANSFLASSPAARSHNHHLYPNGSHHHHHHSHQRSTDLDADDITASPAVQRRNRSTSGSWTKRGYIDTPTAERPEYFDGSGSNAEKVILVTGGAGYVGSHTVVELLESGYRVVVADNLMNSSEESLRRIQHITKRPLHFHNCDVTSPAALDTLFTQHKVWAVLHFAALKAVGESAKIPLDYYANNLTGSINLLQAMRRHSVKNFVFSSSATVYGEPEMSPVNEKARLGPVTNPYGRTKLFIEEALRDLCKSDEKWNVIILRYFNPVGAHPSGLLGEHPRGIPNNLLPYVTQVVQGHLPLVKIYGKDYDTIDGTGVRDYVHVCDLAVGHVAALRKLATRPGCVAYNLGTGIGYSVLQIVQAMGRATGRQIPYQIMDRRPGDVATCTADATLANRELGWVPTRSLDEMCEDLWRWTRRNPKGYDSPLLPSDEDSEEFEEGVKV